MTASLLATVQRLATHQRTKKALIVLALTACLPVWSASFTAAQTPVDTRSQAAMPVNYVAPQAASPNAPQPTAQVDAQRMAAIILAKNALLAVNQGNLTGNYTVLRDLSSPGFRERNSAADLAAIFQVIRQQKIDLSPIIVLDPVLNEPRLDAQGQLALTGFFVAQQIRINFQLLFLKADSGGWMIHGVSLNAVPEAAATASAVPR